MSKRKYIKPQIDSIIIDNEISLILMSWDDEDNPPDDPFGAANQQANPFEENSFKDNN